MKPQTEKSSDQVMRFFTPELFLRFNSTDDEVADRADEEWEAAIQEYRDHLDRLGDQLPAQVKKLASLCLHDAEILALEQPIEPLFAVSSEHVPPWSGFAILSVRQGDEVVILFYSLWDRVNEHRPEDPWPFSRQRPHWLYDEIDVAPNRQDRFIHRVLLSDGTIMEIPFVSVHVHIIALEEKRAGDSTRQIA
jgi:hypothetical protein